MSPLRLLLFAALLCGLTWGYVRLDYKFRAIDPVYYKIDILIDPCRNATMTGGLGVNCCKNAGRDGCQDYSDIAAGPDLQIAYFQNAHIPKCEGLFANDPNCGTYLEVHKAGNYTIEAAVELTEEWPVGYNTLFVPTYMLCAGAYEFWWVVRTRYGPYVQYGKPFWVKSPSCDDPIVAAAVNRLPADPTLAGLLPKVDAFSPLSVNMTASNATTTTTTTFVTTTTAEP
eukprot:GDKI01006382.1.p1 GENE.GDKI01006382.1~~GDKI01006382.1.p1  ORF type:complete len:228 (+),score=67.34 GDKI01006382.1:95-778(+)